MNENLECSKKLEYPQIIQDAVKALCNVLEKDYPEIIIPILVTKNKSPFQERMEMGVYIELIKAGEKFEKFHAELQEN